MTMSISQKIEINVENTESSHTILALVRLELERDGDKCGTFVDGS